MYKYYLSSDLRKTKETELNTSPVKQKRFSNYQVL